MLFFYFYLIQEKKNRTWFVPPASREYFGITPTAFLVKKKTKNYPLVKRTIKYVF